MLRAILATAVLLAVQQPSLTGEWSANLMTPRGTAEYTMYLNQEGPRLTGYFQSQYGEIPLKGSVNGSDIKLSWELVDGGKTLAVTMTGTVKGDAINGEADIATVGKGPFTAERSSSAAAR